MEAIRNIYYNIQSFLQIFIIIYDVCFQNVHVIFENIAFSLITMCIILLFSLFRNKFYTKVFFGFAIMLEIKFVSFSIIL